MIEFIKYLIPRPTYSQYYETVMEKHQKILPSEFIEFLDSGNMYEAYQILHINRKNEHDTRIEDIFKFKDEFEKNSKIFNNYKEQISKNETRIPI